jgi:hypothetical protein
MRSLIRLVSLGILPLVALQFSGCGDDTIDETGDSGATTQSTTAPQDSNGSTNTPSSTSDPSNTTTTDVGSSTAESSGDSSGTASEGGSESQSETSADSSASDDDDEVADPGVLVDALCAWTYRCCTDGERDSILGPHFSDEADCSARMRDEMAKNDPNPPTHNLNFVDELLASLAYEIDLSRSEAIPKGIAACLAEIEARECNDDPADPTYQCVPFDDGACALTNLFRGRVAAGGECNGNLRGPTRDIECVRGSSCEDTNLDVLDPGFRFADDDDSEDVFKCVAKGLEGDLCNPSANDDEAEGPCEYGFYCAPDGHCATLPGEGEHCEFSDPDNPRATSWWNLYSPGTDPDLTFSLYKGNEAIPCDFPYDCDPVTETCSKWCDSGSLCDWESAGGWDGGNVASNGLEDSTLYNCNEGLSCIPVEFLNSPGNYVFHCRAPGGVGDICNDDGDCESAYYCHGVDGGARRTLAGDDDVAGTCRLRLEEGKACNGDDTQCGANLFCGACGLLELRSEAGDLSDAPFFGDCDIDDDGDIDVGLADDDDDGEDDRTNTVTHVCQPILPISTAADHLCAGDALGGDLADLVTYSDVACKTGANCVYTSRLSNGDDVDPGYYCISTAIGSNVTCAPGEGDSYFESGHFPSFQDAQLPWSNYCSESYICYDPDNYAAPTCRAAVVEGQPCDYDPTSESKGQCAPDLHCVAGTCAQFLQPGEPCNVDCNDWSATDPEIAANGFDEPCCSPLSASCQEIHGGYYCQPYAAFTYIANYCVDSEGSN